MADIKRIKNQREQLGETTIRVVTLLKASPLPSRQAFAVDLFAADSLADRINLAWMIIKGKTYVRGEVAGVDEHETEAV